MQHKIAAEMLKDPAVKEAADKFYKLGRQQARNAIVYYKKVAQGEMVAPEDLSEEEAADLANALAGEGDAASPEGGDPADMALEGDMPEEEEGAQLASDLITQAIIDQANETPELVPDDVQEDLVDAAIAVLGGDEVVAALGDAASEEGTEAAPDDAGKEDGVEKKEENKKEEEEMVTPEDVKSASLFLKLLNKEEK